MRCYGRDVNTHYYVACAHYATGTRWWYIFRPLHYIALLLCAMLDLCGASCAAFAGQGGEGAGRTPHHDIISNSAKGGVRANKSSESLRAPAILAHTHIVAVSSFRRAYSPTHRQQHRRSVPVAANARSSQSWPSLLPAKQSQPLAPATVQHCECVRSSKRTLI